MATAQGLARVAQINATIAKQGQAAPNPTAGQNAVTLSNQSSANPADRYSSSATAAPKTDAELGIAPTKVTNTSQPNPQTNPQSTEVNPPNATNPDLASAIAGKGSALTSQEMASTDTVQQYAQRYKQGLATVKAQNTPVPTTSGEAATVVATNTPTKQTPPPVPANVTAHFDPTQNPNIQQSTQDIIDFIYPENVRSDLFSQMSKIRGEQNVLAQEQLQLMNIKNVMAGTEDDIRSEIQAVGGLGTESQIQALTIGRNKTLLKEATFLQDQIQYQQSLIANDTQLMQFEKDMANTQATQRMSILQYQQTNYNNMMNAARQSINTLIKTPGGLQGYLGDPQQTAYAEQLMGWPSGTIASMASQPNLDQELKRYQIQGQQLENQKLALEAQQSAQNTIAATKAEETKLNTQVTTAETVLNKVNQSVDLLGVSSTGLVGNILQHIGGTNARDLQGNIDTLKANLAFGELQKMRDASKTGGALGQVSEGEEKLLSSTVASLDIGQSKAQLTNSLNEIRKHYINWLALNGYSVAPNGDIVKIQ